MKIGKNMRTLINTMERLGAELGRPPCLTEIKDQVPDLDRGNLTKSMQSLQQYGLVELVGHGHYILKRTLDGRRVSYTQHVGLIQ